MTDELKNFINENIDLINENSKESWQEIYNEISTEWYNIGKFTEIMLIAGIDPASKLGYIPEFYLFDTSITDYKIPNGVTSIRTCAFRECENLISVEISDTVTNIGDYAFLRCKKLKNVAISASVTTIASEAFRECKKLKQLHYKGTKKQFNDNLKARWIEYSSIQKIICTDGVIEL